MGPTAETAGDSTRRPALKHLDTARELRARLKGLLDNSPARFIPTVRAAVDALEQYLHQQAEHDAAQASALEDLAAVMLFRHFNPGAVALGNHMYNALSAVGMKRYREWFPVRHPPL